MPNLVSPGAFSATDPPLYHLCAHFQQVPGYSGGWGLCSILPSFYLYPTNIDALPATLGWHGAETEWPHSFVCCCCFGEFSLLQPHFLEKRPGLSINAFPHITRECCSSRIQLSPNPRFSHFEAFYSTAKEASVVLQAWFTPYHLPQARW